MFRTVTLCLAVWLPIGSSWASIEATTATVERTSGENPDEQDSNTESPLSAVAQYHTTAALCFSKPVVAKRADRALPLGHVPLANCWSVWHRSRQIGSEAALSQNLVKRHVRLQI